MEEDNTNTQQRRGSAAGVWILVVQAVLIFGLETWVVTPHMEKDLGRFQDQVARWMKGRLLQRKSDGK